MRIPNSLNQGALFGKGDSLLFEDFGGDEMGVLDFNAMTMASLGRASIPTNRLSMVRKSVA